MTGSENYFQNPSDSTKISSLDESEPFFVQIWLDSDALTTELPTLGFDIPVQTRIAFPPVYTKFLSQLISKADLMIGGDASIRAYQSDFYTHRP